MGECARRKTAHRGTATPHPESAACAHRRNAHRSGRTGSAAPLARRRGCASVLPSRSEEHTSELQSLMRISYAVFCLKKKKTQELVYLSRPHTQLSDILHARAGTNNIPH